VSTEEKKRYGTYAEHVSYSWKLDEFYNACAINSFFLSVSASLDFQVREVDEAIEVAEDACEKAQEMEEEIEVLRKVLKDSQDHCDHTTATLMEAKKELKMEKKNKQQSAEEKVVQAEKSLAAANERLTIAKEECATIPSITEKLGLEKEHARQLIKKAIFVAHTVAVQKERADQQAQSGEISMMMLTALTAPTAPTAAQQRTNEASMARNKVEELRQKWTNWIQKKIAH
jgi:hypothetical protein